MVKIAHEKYPKSPIKYGISVLCIVSHLSAKSNTANCSSRVEQIAVALVEHQMK